MRMRLPILATVGVLAAALVAARPLLKGDPPKQDAPPPPPAWAPLQNAPGLAVRNPERAYTVPTVAEHLRYSGLVALYHGGALQVADISGPMQGAEFPPHKSHRNGRDADVGYTLTEYPTPAAMPASYGFAQTLQALRPYLDVVFTSPARKAELEALATTYTLALPKLQAIAGHQGHAHLRFE